MRLTGPSIALLELESIARGIYVADAVVKRAQVLIDRAEPVSPGKYLLLFHGEVAEVEEAFAAGVETAGPTLLDRLLLPQAAAGLIAALGSGTQGTSDGESLGIVETHTVASALLAADTALKRADVRLLQLALARGIGGKGYFTVAGSQDMVEAALEGAGGCIDPSLLLATELISQPHPDIQGRRF